MSYETSVGMIDRFTIILDAFEDRTSRLTLEQLTRRTQLPRSTVHRILNHLVRLEWVERTPCGYRMGRRMLRAGDTNIGSGHGEIRSAAAPLLQELHVRTGMVVHLAVLDAGESVYLDKVGGRGASSLPSRVGGREPAYSTACGKSMLALLAPERVDGLYGKRLQRRTERTIGDVPMLHRELNSVRRRRGVAFEHGESFRGVACVGAAIRSSDGPIAGISVSGGDAGTTRFERVAPLVAAVAREVALAL